jgi:hypothetical protein
VVVTVTITDDEIIVDCTAGNFRPLRILRREGSPRG